MFLLMRVFLAPVQLVSLYAAVEGKQLMAILAGKRFFHRLAGIFLVVLHVLKTFKFAAAIFAVVRFH